MSRKWRSYRDHRFYDVIPPYVCTLLKCREVSEIGLARPLSSVLDIETPLGAYYPDSGFVLGTDTVFPQSPPLQNPVRRGDPSLPISHLLWFQVKRLHLLFGRNVHPIFRPDDAHETERQTAN